jgi:PAS domain S-box-containing protein
MYPTFMTRFLKECPWIGALLINLDGVIQWGNSGAHVIFGASPGDLEGTAYETLFTPEDRAHEAMQTELVIARSRGYSEDDRWHLRKDGSRFWASGILSVVRSEDGALAAYAKIVRNRTDLKEQIVALRSEVAACREQAARRASAVAEAAHEIRNSLTGVAGLLGTLRQNVVMTEPMSRLADISDRQLNIVRRLTEDLMSANANQRAAPGFQITRQPLQPILNEAIELIGPSLGTRDVRLLAPLVPIECKVDHERLLQMLINLLRNAIKFTSDDGKIWVKLTVEGSRAVVRIEDNGIGIAPNMLDRIFDAFTQADNASTGESGVGLGLAVAKETVTLLGGSIQALSDGVGEGASFSIRLPLAP